MKSLGKVVSINGNNVKVQLKRSSACGDSCASCKGGCTPTTTVVELSNDIGAKVGQTVEVEMSDNNFMKAVGVSYMFPLIMLMIGIAIGYGIYDSLAIKLSQEIFSFLVGMSFITISYFIVNRIDKKYRKSDKFKLTITRIL